MLIEMHVNVLYVCVSMTVGDLMTFNEQGPVSWRVPQSGGAGYLRKLCSRDTTGVIMNG